MQYAAAELELLRNIVESAHIMTTVLCHLAAVPIGLSVSTSPGEIVRFVCL